MRTLFTQTKRDLPPPAFEKTRIVRTRTFTACALHANHGRALTCGNSTLGPGVRAGPKETGQDQQRRDQKVFVGKLESLEHSTCLRVPSNSLWTELARARTKTDRMKTKVTAGPLLLVKKLRARSRAR